MQFKNILAVIGATSLSGLLVISCVDDNMTRLSEKIRIDSTATLSKTATTTVSTITTTSTSSTTSTSTSGTTSTNTTTAAQATVSFSKNIQPILAKYQCASCHGNSYYAFAGVSSLARSGQLLGTMSWAAGYRKMPPTQKAAASELSLISTWIKEGTLNN